MTPVTAAKAYRLLRAVMNTAADDGLIRRNPCRLKGAGQERSPERPVLTLRQVLALAEAVDARYRALILLAVFGSLRWAELAALRRCDIDLDARTVCIFRQLAESPGGGFAFGPPKSQAGQRTVVFPDLIVPDLAWHLRAIRRAARRQPAVHEPGREPDAEFQLPPPGVAPGAGWRWPG